MERGHHINYGFLTWPNFKQYLGQMAWNCHNYSLKRVCALASSAFVRSFSYFVHRFMAIRYRSRMFFSSIGLKFWPIEGALLKNGFVMLIIWAKMLKLLALFCKESNQTLYRGVWSKDAGRVYIQPILIISFADGGGALWKYTMGNNSLNTSSIFMKFYC